jgi:hypothetical protein
MRCIFCFAPVLILLICGSACTSTKAPSPPNPPFGAELNAPPSPDFKPQLDTAMRAQLDAAMKAKLKVAQYELQLYEEELKATKEEIRQAEAGKGASPSLLNWKNELTGKVIQTKVKIRELETPLSELH